MAFKTPYGSHNFLGNFADDSTALTFIRAVRFDSTKDGNGNPEEGMWYSNLTSNKPRYYNGTSWEDIGGNVVGPSSSTNEGVVRFDGITGTLIQDSSVIIGDDGYISIPSGQKYKIDGVDLSAVDVGAEPTLTKGNLTELNSDILNIVGGDDSVIGSGTSIQVQKASSLQDGYLGKDDFTTFSNIDLKWDYINRNGFVDNTETTVSFNNSNYTFTLNSVGDSWKYFRNGKVNSISGNKSVVLPGTPPATNAYYIFIDDDIGTLTTSTSAWTLDDNKVLVQMILWNNDNTPQYILAEERHTCLIDKQIHKYLHETKGTQLVSGGTLDGFSVTPTSPVDTNNTFSIEQTTIADEDLYSVLNALTDPDGNTNVYTSLYRTGSSSWTWERTPVPFKYGSGSYIQYDNSGTLTTGQHGKAYNWYLLFTNCDGYSRFMMTPGRSEFSNASAAYAELPGNFTWSGFPIKECIVAYQLTFETNSSYSTKGKCRLSRTPQKLNISLTTTAVAGGPIDHNSLSGLQGGIDSERYHLANNFYINATRASSSSTDGYLTSTDWTTFNSKESALTFSTGLTRATNTITSDISTGKVGGQSIYGGTAAGEDLTIYSTSNAIKGNIYFGASTYDEVNDRWGIGTLIPEADIHIDRNTYVDVIFRTATNTNTHAPFIEFQRSRGTLSSKSIVQTGDSLGLVDFLGYDGSSFYTGGYIDVIVEGTPTTGIVSGSFVFYTRNAVGTLDERMRLTSDGYLQVGLAGGTTGQINLLGTTSGIVNLKVKNTAGTWTMTLPDSAGTDGYLLQTDGSGNTSWIKATSGANTSLSNLSSVAINTTLLPGSNDGAGLGSGTYSFSDLFLASGGVINWANGDVTVTHATDALTVFGASSISLNAPDTNHSLLYSTSFGVGYGSNLLLQHGRGTRASYSALGSGDGIGGIVFGGTWDTSSGFANQASIACYTTQPWSNSNVGCAITFNTTANATSTAYERLRINHNGYVGIGCTNPVSLLELSTDTTGSIITVSSYGTSPSQILVARGKGTRSSYTAVQNTDMLGVLQFGGTWDTSNGVAYQASISSVATQSWSNSNVGCDLRFSTTANATANIYERMRVTHDGILQIGLAGVKTGQINLLGSTSGTVSFKVKDVAGSWTITLPDSVGTSGYFLKTDGTGVTSWAAPTSTAITVMSETSDAICYPVFVTAETGDLGPKTYPRFSFNSLDCRLGVGCSNPISIFELSTDAASSIATVSSYGTSESIISFARGKGTRASYTAVQNTDALGVLRFGGTWDTSNGVAYQSSIVSVATQSWSNSNVGCDLRFYTTANATPNIYERMRITHDGILQIGLTGVKTGQINLLGTTSGTVSLKVADIAGSWTMTLPSAAPGVNGYVLSSTTGGVCSWVMNGTGDVVGPGSSTNEGIVRFDGTTGKLIQNSSVIVGDDGYVSIPSGQKYKINGVDLSATDVGAEPTLDKTNLTETASSILAITNGTGAVIGASPVTIQVQKASALQDGYLGKDDFTTFSSGSNIIKGDVTEGSGSNVLAFSGDAVDSVFGNGFTITVSQATSGSDGYLTSVDWNTFNNKLLDPMTTRGDVIYRNSSNITDRLPLADDGYFLASNGYDLIWKQQGCSTYFLQEFTNETEVVVDHSFGTYPVVQVMDSSNNVLIPESIQNTSVDSLTVTFSVQTSGKVIAVLGTNVFFMPQSIVSPGGLLIGDNKMPGTNNVPGKLRFWSAGDNPYYTSFITGEQTQNCTYTLPIAFPASSKILQCDSDGYFTWVDQTGGAPMAATYWTSQAESGLSEEVNIGALTSGVLYATVSGGIATPSTVARANLTETSSSILTILNGTNAVLGSGTTIQVNKSSASQDGYLGKDDWATFNAKLTSPLSVNGDILYYNSGHQKLGIGSSNQILTVVGGLPSWQDLSSSSQISSDNTKAYVKDTGSDGYFAVVTEGVERFRIKPDGNIGVGTNDPTSRLDVVGDIEIGSTNWLYLGDPTTNSSWRFGISDGNVVLQRRETGVWVEKYTFNP